MNKHTPTPWEVVDHKWPGCGTRFHVFGATTSEPYTVADMIDGGPEGMDEANAHFIVKACNHYAELEEALADAIEALEVAGEWLAAKTSQEILDRVRNDTP